MPDFSLEQKYSKSIEYSKNINSKRPMLVAGVDEVGYGPWAGPVVTAAVIIDQSKFPADLVSQINDSKKLSPKKRDQIYHELMAQNNSSCYISTNITDVDVIDKHNILRATLMSMSQSINSLEIKPDLVLVDGIRAPVIDGNDCKYEFICVKQGDSISISIASASIIAKVTRDNLMQELHKEHPEYGWNSNVGYGTKAHKQAIARIGITKHHRRSYKPIAHLLKLSFL